MLTLTILAALLLGLASVYATVKAWSALASLDLLSWMCWGQAADALGSLLSAVVKTVADE